MTTSKTWTYEEITEATRERIRMLSSPLPGGDELRRQWAYGAYLNWYWTTLGYQNEGDNEAMERLANGGEVVTA